MDDKVYDLVEIPSSSYMVYTYNNSYPVFLREGEPDKNFSHFYYTSYNVTKYKAIFINDKFYAPKLVENVQ
jgi:hypothetical protein